MVLSSTKFQTNARNVGKLVPPATIYQVVRHASLDLALGRQFACNVAATNTYKAILAKTVVSTVSSVTQALINAKSALKTQSFKPTELAVAKRDFSSTTKLHHVKVATIPVKRAQMPHFALPVSLNSP